MPKAMASAKNANRNPNLDSGSKYKAPSMTYKAGNMNTNSVRAANLKRMGK